MILFWNNAVMGSALGAAELEKKMFTCQCNRCNGAGKYDRGTCFDCKGLGYKNRSTQPRGLTPFVLTVTFSNGSTNNPKVWATRQQIAVSIVERTVRIKGWSATVAA